MSKDCGCDRNTVCDDHYFSTGKDWNDQGDNGCVLWFAGIIVVIIATIAILSEFTSARRAEDSSATKRAVSVQT